MPRDKAAIALAIHAALANTAIAEARRIQELLEIEYEDLGLHVSITPSGFSSDDFLVSLDFPDDCHTARCSVSESSAAWWRECRTFARRYRRSPASNGMTS